MVICDIPARFIADVIAFADSPCAFSSLVSMATLIISRPQIRCSGFRGALAFGNPEAVCSAAACSYATSLISAKRSIPSVLASSEKLLSPMFGTGRFPVFHSFESVSTIGFFNRDAKPTGFIIPPLRECLFGNAAFFQMYCRRCGVSLGYLA